MKIRFFHIAQKLAEKSTHRQHKVGCVIVKKNRVISIGWNQMKTHPKAKTYDSYLHAEMHALLGNSLEDLDGAECYVIRVRRSGTYGLARPCAACEAALRAAGIKIMHYSDYDNSFMSEEL